jgi:CRISPR-associated endonuclease Csn1
VAQKGESMWAIRKPLHKETVFAYVNLRRVKAIPFNKALENPSTIVNKDLKHLIKTLMEDGMDKKKVLNFFKKEDGLKFHGQDISKVEVYYFTDDVEKMVAVRKPLDDSFDAKKIQSITDTGIQKILLNYLATKYNDPKVAFSPEGIMEMNEHIEEFNGGKPHQPILKVRVSETLGEKYPVGYGSNKDKKFVEAQKGTNLYFAVYEDKDGNRNYKSIPLYLAAERMKQHLSPVPEVSNNGDKLKFYLSPNDLVYVPEESEQNGVIVDLKKDRIYKFVSSTGSEAYFIPCNVATVLMSKVEYQAKNKVQFSLESQLIKAVCWKLEVDRLGNIVKIIK